ncbi:hypothetical protein Clacol_005755 [Clathrus columnatus]|uniref:Glutathione S-transferase n=1 Tax=Clathrus columnatus TaxID=1419009 RepID=A0AAV5AA69_9AGAM|nr:hypothetical protein Clacol_005755 [Clathrus columnatus]
MSSPRVTLYANVSPAAQCVTVALEELDIPYEIKTLSLIDKEQKSDWYLKINPNGRLPTLIDHSKEDFAVWESSAILLYIAQHFDTEHKISYDPVSEPKLYSEQLQWIFFAHGGIAPMYDESTRLFSVLEGRLKDREWLVGPHYSLADIKAFLWIHGAKIIGLNLVDYPNLQKWLGRIVSRPKTDKAMGIPERMDVETFVKKPIEETRAIGAALFGFKKVE